MQTVRVLTARVDQWPCCVSLADSVDIPSCGVHWIPGQGSTPCTGEDCNNCSRTATVKSWAPCMVNRVVTGEGLDAACRQFGGVKRIRFDGPNWQPRVVELTENVRWLKERLRPGMAFVLFRKGKRNVSPVSAVVVRDVGDLIQIPEDGAPFDSGEVMMRAWGLKGESIEKFRLPETDTAFA